MSKGKGTMHGPVCTPMEDGMISGSGHDAAEGTITNGMPGYPKGTPTEMAEVTFDTGGAFGKIRPVKE